MSSNMHSTDEQILWRLRPSSGNTVPLNQKTYQSHRWFWRFYLATGLRTVPDKAATLGEMDVLRHIVSQGADTSMQDWYDQIAIHCAKDVN